MSRLRALLKKHRLEPQFEIKTIAKKGYLLQLQKRKPQKQAVAVATVGNFIPINRPQLMFALGMLLLLVFVLGRRTAGNPITVTLSATFGN